ncbi:hypothetical protein HHK36_009929 [Tetracentron sinense]|uniref:Uncharacterized protein n=1 Tax=Tetracentron sinense TaxID=13715 RepID=A0A835DHZ7_TETSI|nr:hypothetical protein HHK36_009929 [Tetracentron sinense]
MRLGFDALAGERFGSGRSMANPGVGSKFVSVNLNKSYGQPSSSRSLGNSGASRIRTGSHGSGGGMVVLSRPRSSIAGLQKSGPKLSVPPPLNLPSLRKEHERFDSSSSGGGSAGAGSSGSGSRPSSSGMGWTKPGPSALQGKDGSADQPFERSGGGTLGVDAEDLPSYSTDGGTRGSSVYMPPSARSGTVGSQVVALPHASLPVAKAAVLRGEDFPSLQATLPATSGPAQKQKDTMHQKQKQKMSEEGSDEQRDSSYSIPLLHMRPQLQSSRLTVGNGSNENSGAGHGYGGSSTTERTRKHEGYFPDPLPLVRLNHRSDWADDERDTGHGLPHQNRDHGFPRSEAYHGREFDLPRVDVLQRTSVHDLPDRWGGLHDDEAGKVSSREVLRTDHYGRDVRTPSREGRDGGSWRAPPLSKEGLSAREITIDRNHPGAVPFSLNRETSKENNYSRSPIGDNVRDGFSSRITGHQDSRFGRENLGYGQGGRHNGNQVVESFSGRGAERNTWDRHSGDPSNRYRGDVFQNSSMPKASFSFGNKGLPVNDTILNFGREKRSFSNSGKPYIEDPHLKDFGGGTGFDGRDPLTGGFVGVVKRKKDALKQANFHDPVRESFEAELERVQKMQEQERQLIIEEQARVLELARKEEEERERLAREEEELRRRLEEEAREAAWRAEQERLEVVRRAEDQKMAREEEKRRILLEEERRKEAARQKLLELEARIARKRAADERMSGVVKEKDASRVADVGDWDDGEKMVERITSSASSDSSSLNRSFESGSRPHSSRDGNSVFLDRAKPANSGKRDMIENGKNSPFLLQDLDNDYRSPMRDAFGSVRAFPRKEFYGGPGSMYPRTSFKGGVQEHRMDDFPHLRGHRWNLSGDGDHYSRNSEIDPEFHESPNEKFDDLGWGQGCSHAPYTERFYHNSEADGVSSFGRSRHSMRQPRVLPPPSLASMQKNSFRGETELPDSSAFLDSEMLYHHAPGKSEPTMHTGSGSGYQEKLEQSGMENSNPNDQKLEKTATPRCDSQSSLSVSSPPSSPTHLSHDDLEDSGDSPVLPAAAEGKEIPLSDSEHVVSATKAGKGNMMAASSSDFPGDDEEWAIENNEALQEQEEYDEEEDGYQEEDEIHEGYDENIDLAQEFEDMHLEEKAASNKMDQLVLGFDEGVEVGMPSNEFESINGKKTIGVQQVSVSIVGEPDSFNGLGGNGQNLQPENSSPEMSMESSSNKIQETEKALQDLVLQPMNVPHVSASSGGYLLDGMEASSSSSLLAQQPVTSSVNIVLPSPSVQPFMSTISPVTSQAEVPVKLPFGLFSGHSLIPSPVPAIQIGSIQMPLHLHPQVGPSLTQIHPSQPPFFQFGQLSYTSPISQGILPLAAQSMSFVHPNAPAHYSLNQNLGGTLHNLGGQDTSTQNAHVKDKGSSLVMDTQPGLVPELLDPSQENESKKVNVLPVRGSAENEVLTSQRRAESYPLGEMKTVSELSTQAENQGHHDMDVKENYKSLANNRESQGQLKSKRASSQFMLSERVLSESKTAGSISGSRGRKLIYAVRNSGSRSSTAPESSPDSNGYQRRARRNSRRNEFRVRDNADRRQTEGLVSSNYSRLDEKAIFNGRVSGISTSGAKKDAILSKPYKQTVESKSLNSGSISSRVIDSEIKMEKGLGKEAPTKRLTSSLDISRYGEGNLKRNSSSEQDVDAPLQSGVVRVFSQPGIETPSNEDDFIEVRSKRQMLNDRREQREKEIKAKSRVIKASRKSHSVSQSIVVTTSSNKMVAPLGGEAANGIPSESDLTDGRGLTDGEISAGFTVALQPLPPIGTPAVNTAAQADTRLHTIKSLQTGSLPVGSSAATNIGQGLSFETRNVIMDNAQTSLGSWGNARINQQV